ncbi:hypothetical protein [Methanosarcina horonobensis]|nr:hypothetical protein [Methanosarcina horonobensis]
MLLVYAGVGKLNWKVGMEYHQIKNLLGVADPSSNNLLGGA